MSLRKDLPSGSPLDQIVQSLTTTILTFFDQVETIDLVALRCDGYDPVWLHFRDALATLRKAIGLQLSNLAMAYEYQAERRSCPNHAGAPSRISHCVGAPPSDRALVNRATLCFVSALRALIPRAKSLGLCPRRGSRVSPTFLRFASCRPGSSPSLNPCTPAVRHEAGVQQD